MKDIIGDNKKFQDAMRRAEDLKLLAKRISEDPDVDVLQGIRRATQDLVHMAHKSARKVSAISKELQTRRQDTKEYSKFGKLVGKVGKVAWQKSPEDAADVLDDLAYPMVKQILETSKELIVQTVKTANNAAKGVERVQKNAIA